MTLVINQDIIYLDLLSENVPSDMYSKRNSKNTCSLITVFLVSITKPLAIQNGLSEDADAQADLNLRWTYISEGTFPDLEDLYH